MQLTLNKEANKIIARYDAFECNIEFKNQSMYYSIKNHQYSIQDATSAIFLENASKSTEVLLPILLSKEDFRPEIQPFTDQAGKGQEIKIQLVFQAKSDQKLRLSTLWKMKIYELTQPDLEPFCSIQIELVEWLEDIQGYGLIGYAPIYAKQTGRLNLVGTEKTPNPKKISFFSNGYQSWSLNHVFFYEDQWKSSFLNMIRINLENQNYVISGRYQSDTHCVISDTTTQSALVIGYVTLKDQFGRILMDRLGSDGKIGWLCAYSQTDSIPLKDLNEGLKRSETVMFTITKNPNAYEHLKEICRIGGIFQAARLPQPSLAGWCSWYYYYTKISEAETLKNLEFFKAHPDVPLQLIQLDDGYQTCVSDWGIDEPYTFNAKFPHGLKWLVDQIHDAKFKSGLWVAPFFTNNKSQLYAKHSDWVLTDKNHKPVKTTYNWGSFQYGLDLSQPDVVNHVERLANTVGEKWGFDFLKIDFIFASEALDGQYKDPRYSRAQILRRGVEAVRRGLGPKRYILGCGAPLGPCVGLVDAMRIGVDTAAVWSMMEKTQKLANVIVPSLKPTLRATMQRSYMHNTYWINDPDCVVVRRNRSKLTLPEVELQLTVFGLSCGQVLISDDMPLVDQDRMDLLKRLLPIYSESAIPLDLFTTKEPTIYALTTHGEIGTRHLAVVINWENKATQRVVKPSDLIAYQEKLKYQSTQKFFVFDYWTEKFLSITELEQEISLSFDQPHSGKYLILIPWVITTESPIQFIHSSFHILSGAVECIKFTATQTNAKIQLQLPSDRTGTLYLYSVNKANAKSSVVGTVETIKLESGQLIKLTTNAKATQSLDIQLS